MSIGWDVLGKINITDGWNFKENVSVLMLTAYGGSIEVFKIILDKTPISRINDRDSKNWTALHYAAASEIGSKTKVQLLLEQHGNISLKAKWDNDNLNDIEGQITPLMIASIEGNDDTTKYLLTKGATVAEKDRRGLTALDYSFYSLNHEVDRYNHDAYYLYMHLIHNNFSADTNQIDRMKRIFFRILNDQYIQSDHSFYSRHAHFKDKLDCADTNATEVMELNKELSHQLARRIPDSKQLSFFEIGDCVYNDCDISLNFGDFVDPKCSYCEQQIRSSKF